MAGQKKKVLFLLDLLVPPPEDGDYSEFLAREEWKPERDMMSVLKGLGHDARVFGLYDDLHPLIDLLKNDPPDVVLNQCEAFRSDRRFEPHVVNFLELMGVSYTGAGPTALRICKDKGLTKKILAFHNIRVPQFEVSTRSKPLKSLEGFPYPAFIKPLKLEASEGISQLSFAEDEQSALDRVKFIHEKLETDAIIEEFIDGREIYMGILGNERLTVFPPRELFFDQVPEGEPKFASFAAKWNETYRERWGIDSGHARRLSKAVEKQLVEISKQIYHYFQLRGYARIDLRVTPAGEVVFLEANPNPSLERGDEFAEAAAKAGLSYEELIAKIISLAGNEP